VIEAVRLAETLASLRDLPLPGLGELREAIQTTLCGGDPAPMALIRDRLEIGEALGAVPAETPAVPLQRDLDATQRRLRLRPSAEINRWRSICARRATGRAANSSTASTSSHPLGQAGESRRGAGAPSMKAGAWAGDPS
jgi:hypothetical protein